MYLEGGRLTGCSQPRHVPILPQQVSPECQQVLQRIFVRDPAQRITIAGIYDQPWFNQNLPTGVKEMNDRYGPKKRLQQVRLACFALLSPSGSLARHGDIQMPLVMRERLQHML